MRLRNSCSASPFSFRVSVSFDPSLNRMRPVSGVSARMMILDKVVLPQPDSPTSPRHSPRFTSKLTSSTASTCFSSPPKKPPLRIAKLLLTFSTSSSGAPSPAPSGQGFFSANILPSVMAISRIGVSRSPGSMPKRGTARSSACR